MNFKQQKCLSCGWMQIPLNYCPNCGQKFESVPIRSITGDTYYPAVILTHCLLCKQYHQASAPCPQTSGLSNGSRL